MWRRTCKPADTAQCPRCSPSVAMATTCPLRGHRNVLRRRDSVPQASLTQLCMALGPVVGLRPWAAAVLRVGHGFLMTSALAREQAWGVGWGALSLPGQDSTTIPCPRPNSQESHFLPHPLQGPDEGGREGLWMDVSLTPDGNGFQMLSRNVEQTLGPGAGPRQSSLQSHGSPADGALGHTDPGILGCSMAELEPGAEVATLGPKAFPLELVQGRQVGKACLTQTLARLGSREKQVGFWVMLPPPSYQTQGGYDSSQN